jgi:bacteriocin-like protein
MKTLDFNEMENVQGGMPCGVALALYGVSFIGVAAATGGVGAVIAWASFGGSIWSLVESC